jgi:diguanylate cyclase (GGDEF)-like protein/PAS domain S-box-containing protein
MSVRKWLLLLMACAIAGIVLLALYGKWQVERIYQDALYVNDVTMPRTASIRSAKIHAGRLNLLLYRYAAAADLPTKTHLAQQVAAEQAVIRGLLQQYESRLSGKEDELLLEADQAAFNAYQAGIPDALAHDTGDAAATLHRLLQRTEIEDRLEMALDRHMAFHLEQGRDGSRQIKGVFNRAAWTTLFLVVVLIGALLIAGRVISRRITEQVERINTLSWDNSTFRTLIENSPDMIIRYDLECRRLYVNQAFLKATGATAAEVLGKQVTAQGWWSMNITAQEYEAHLRAVARSGQPSSLRLHGLAPHSDEMWHTMARIVPEFDARGEVESLLVVVRDVTDLALTEQELRQREQYQRALLDNFPFFVWLKDTDSRLLAANQQYARVAKVATTQELEGKTDFDFFPHALAKGYVEDDRMVLADGMPKNVVEQFCDEEGQWKWMETYKSPLVVDGETVGTVGFSRDITEKMQLQMDLASREREFRTLVENSPDTICRYDADCKRIYVNPRMAESFGISLPELLGTVPAEHPGGDSAQTYEQAIRQVFASSEAVDFELNWQNGAGQGFCTHIRLMPEFGAEEGEVVSVLAVGRDITEIDEYRKRVHHMAFFDTLTGLPNRALLNDRIGHTIADAAYHGHRFGLMVLDLDGFKEVNDTLGHGTGDLLLCEVGMRLLACVRSYDTVARLGGDEFSVLLPEVRQDSDVGTVARKILDALARPFTIGGKELFISASIGIALYPSDSAEIDALFRYADSAMYHAKKQGRNNFQFYSKEITARSTRRMALESALRRAQEKNELELYYQPQMDIINDRLIGAEALLRWNRKGHDMVPPDHFIPIAEETGLIVDIGEWVLMTACEAAVAWNRDRKTPLKVSVNLSTRQFLRNNLVESIKIALTMTGCKPEWLGLEITESLLLDDVEEIRGALEELDAVGLSIAIDDFGTGYSALGYLNRFPVSVLKIDRSFVHGITTDRDRAELVKAIVSMARSLRMGLVAEGVETDAQAAYLSNLGCHVAQGYLYGRPMPRADFEALLLPKSDMMMLSPGRQP